LSVWKFENLCLKLHKKQKQKKNAIWGQTARGHDLSEVTTPDGQTSNGWCHEVKQRWPSDEHIFTNTHLRKLTLSVKTQRQEKCLHTLDFLQSREF